MLSNSPYIEMNALAQNPRVYKKKKSAFLRSMMYTETYRIVRGFFRLR